ncbi:MAG: porin [Alphaproteobacteria bacterium]
MLTGKRTKALMAAGLVLAAPFALAGGAQAQSNAELMRLIQQLNAKVEQLEGQVQNATATAAAADTKASEAQKTASAGGGDMKYKWAPSMTFKSADGRFEMHVRGRVMVDFGHMNPDVGNKRTATEFRRARLGIEGKAWKDVKYKFEIDFADNSVDITDAYVQYRGWKPVKITVGQFKEFVSLEEQTSSRHISVMERAAFTDAFGFGRRIGIGFEGEWNGFGIGLGVYGGSDISVNEDNEGYAFAGRLYYNVDLANDNGALHVGGSFRYRDLDNDIDEGGAAGRVRYRQRPFTHIADRFISTDRLPYVESDTFYGAELAASIGPFWASTEFGWLDADVMSGMEGYYNGESKINFKGGYIDVGWFITGENRPLGGGDFGRPKVKKPLFEGGMGAIALAARVDYIDLTDVNAGVVGGEQISYIFGVNWYWNRHTRVTLNYARVEIDDGSCTLIITCVEGDATVGPDGKNSIDVITARFAVDW